MTTSDVGAWDATTYDRQFSFVTSLGADLLGMLDIQRDERVLDIGCGTGHQAAALAERGALVTGLDADEAMVAAAVSTYPVQRYPGLCFVHADAQELPGSLGDASFDAVLSNAALHWMPRQDAVAAGVAAVLRPGGRAVIEMGGQGCVSRVLDSIVSARAALGLPALRPPQTFPSVSEQASTWEQAGFIMRYVVFFDRMTPLGDGTTVADWARMFGASLVADIPPALRGDFDTTVDAEAAARGLDARPDGEPGWWADYVRLRFLAERRS